MTRTYFLSSVADQDVDKIATYIAMGNPHAAHTFLDEIYDAFQLIAENPDIGHTREDLINKPVKCWTFKWHYLVIYKPITPLEIVRVLSGYRDIAELV